MDEQYFILYDKYMTDSEWVITIDAGHGGIIDGVYDTAPNKMYDHGDFIFYEGEFNRSIAVKLADKLRDEDISHLFTTVSNTDVALPVRVIRSNNFGRTNKDKKQLFLSIHGNAAPLGAESATGIEVFTSKGDTPADPIAEIFFEELKTMGWKMRKDSLDGDSDKEANFYVLKHTFCPAVLLELGFYTNREQAEEMMEKKTQDRMVDCIMRAIRRIIKEDSDV